MDFRIPLILAIVFIQSLSAKHTPSPPNGLRRPLSKNGGKTFNSQSDNAAFLTEVENLRRSTNQITQEIMLFTEPIIEATPLEAPLRSLMDEVVQSVTTNSARFLNNLETARKNAGKAQEKSSYYDYDKKLGELINESDELLTNNLMLMSTIEDQLKSMLEGAREQPEMEEPKQQGASRSQRKNSLSKKSLSKKSLSKKGLSRTLNSASSRKKSVSRRRSSSHGATNP